MQGADDTVETVALTACDDAGLEAISHERRLALDLAEMRAIQAYYRGQGRQPTDVELEMLAQTWSEHCVHKTFKALVSYEEHDAGGTPVPGAAHDIDSLLKTYIRGATEQVGKPWVRSAFVDNAGIVAYDDGYDVAFKVETHNHPSALEPFGGANTGVGGVVRDVIGVSARPVANTDVLCFGPPDLPYVEVPPGVLHPRRIADGVTAGVEDYGNKMGIPTVNGAILYDPGYTANPLVFCGCLGILPHGSHRAAAQPGDLVVVHRRAHRPRRAARGDLFLHGNDPRDRTDRGQRGADRPPDPRETGARSLPDRPRRGAVHRHHRLRRGRAVFGDRRDGRRAGRGGAPGARAAQVRRPAPVGDLAERGAGAHGARRAAGPLATRCRKSAAGSTLRPPPSARSPATAASPCATTSQIVGLLDAEFLHHGIPRRHLSAIWTRPALAEPAAAALPDPEGDLTPGLLALLAAPNLRSKEDVVRRYDHEVQAGTVVKPFVGRANAGPGDAAVLDLELAELGYGLGNLSPSPSPTRGGETEAGVGQRQNLSPTQGRGDRGRRAPWGGHRRGD